MTKSLVEQIRDMVEKSREHGNYPTFNANCLVDDHCESSEEFERKLFTEIADRIEREYVPLPRFEDGEPVKVGDMVLWNDNEAKRVEGIHVEVHLEGSCGTYNSVIKRPEPDVLDADGVPINVGDTVYVVEKNITTPIGNKEVVESIERGIVFTDQGGWEGASLSHKEPDTLERIYADTRKTFDEYWGCDCIIRCKYCPAVVDGKRPYELYEADRSCETAMMLDLLRRQRKVLERGQE